MKVIGINASPRKNANTQTLVAAALAGAEEKGASIRLVNLRELEINGCLGCEWCKKHLGQCVQKDDLTTLMQAMTAYDAVIMGTPIYWYQVAGQFKLLVDRLYSFFEFIENAETGAEEINSAFPAGKKGLFIISRGDAEPPPAYAQMYAHLDEWMNLVPYSLGMERYEYLHQYGAGLDRKAAKADGELLARARAMGAALAV